MVASYTCGQTTAPPRLLPPHTPVVFFVSYFTPQSFQKNSASHGVPQCNLEHNHGHVRNFAYQPSRVCWPYIGEKGTRPNRDLPPIRDSPPPQPKIQACRCPESPNWSRIRAARAAGFLSVPFSPSPRPLNLSLGLGFVFVLCLAAI